MTRYPTELERNDVPAALRWVEDHYRAFGGPPEEDAIAILLQLQDEPDELEAKLDDLFSQHEPQPEERVVESNAREQ